MKYVGPVLDALQQLGGSGRPDEVRSVIAERLKLSEEEQSESLPSKAQPRFDNQVHWARFYLSKGGFVGSSKRGVWALTEKGRAALPVSDADARAIFRDVAATFAKGKPTEPEIGKSTPSDDVAPPSNDSPAVEQSYRNEVASKLQALSGSAFERFCQRLLRESGFQEVSITGRSGDGGIDGVGLLQVNPLVNLAVEGTFRSVSSMDGTGTFTPPKESDRREVTKFTWKAAEKQAK